MPLRAPRLLLFWRLLAAVRGDPCDPTLFLIHNGTWFDGALAPLSAVTPTGVYCGAPEVPYAGGGPGKGWFWGAGGCIVGTSLCKCDSQHAGSVCRCRSSLNSNIEMCYTQVYPCIQKCDQGRYVSGCGCVDCRNLAGDGCTTTVDPDTGESSTVCPTDQSALQEDYTKRMALFGNADLFNFLDHTCADDGFRTGYLCGPGVCRPCPVGYYCPDGVRAYPCPGGTFQARTGQVACEACTLVTHVGGCLASGDVVSNCDPVRGWKTPLLPCGDCTPLPGNLTLQTIGVDRCTCRGLVPGMVNDTNNVCRQCAQCSGRRFSRANNDPFYCAVTDGDCVPMYYDSTKTSGYNCHVDPTDPKTLNPARRKNGMVCQGLDDDTKIVHGDMPWRAGYARTLPPDSWRQIPGDDQMGLVPYYKACPITTPPQYYQWRTDTSGLDGLPWDEVPRIDCQSLYAYECGPGSVAVLFPADNGPRQLEACAPCGPNGHSPGGLNAQCVCDEGFGNMAQIQTLLGNVSVLGQVRVTPERTCLDCAAGVVFNHAETSNEPYAEALACALSPTQTTTTIQRCNGVWQYVKDRQCQSCWSDDASSAPSTICPVSIKYTAHATRRIPRRNRTACELCPPGTYIALKYGTVYECRSCPPGSYQNTQGQCGCFKKRTFCPMGQQLVLHTAETEDPTRDAECENCTTQCEGDQITVYQDADHSTAGATCNGHGQYYFGCFSDTTFGGLGPDTLAGHRLSFDTEHSLNESPTSALLTACDEGLLPNRSRFVAYHAPASTGLECHFACLYGVDAKVAQNYSAAISKYAHTNKLLVPFLPQAEPSSAWSQNVVVPAPWTPGSTRPTAWTVYETWTPGADGGAPLEGNTFLFDANFLQNQKSVVLDDLCLTPEAAYTSRCPAGMRQATPLPLPECALLARTRSHMVSKGTQSVMAVLSDDPSVTVAQCIADARGYTGFRVGCARACLEVRRDKALALLASQPPGGLWYARAAWAFYLISPDAWYTSYAAFQPYDFPYAYGIPSSATDSSSLQFNASNFTYTSTHALFTLASPNASQPCDVRCVWSGATSKTFRYDPATAHADETQLDVTLAQLIAPSFPVCVPCDFQLSGRIVSFGTSVCQQLFGVARYFDNRLCLSGLPNVTELTTDHVCSRCALTKPNATLIDSRLDPTAWSNWYALRNHIQGQSAAFWDTTCRYRCDSGYGSNPNGKAAYDAAPCLPCATFACQTYGNAMYVSAAAQCGQNPSTNYGPVELQCASCEALNKLDGGHQRYLFQGNLSQPVASDGLCPAICHPDYYQTVYVNDQNEKRRGEPGVYYPFSRLECIPCAHGDPNFPCANVCQNDHYKNATGGNCVACNTSRCPEGQFRERCVSGNAFADAPCRDRDANALSNPAEFPAGTLAIGPSHPAYAALNRSRGRPSRRWLTPAERNLSAPIMWLAARASPVPEQVALVCLNNWAWVDVRTGQSPWANSSSGALLMLDPAAFFCVECTALVTDGTDRRLYSVWNASDNSTAYAAPVRGLHSVLDSLASVWGGCYACYGARDVDAHSQTLCELPPGHSPDAPDGCGLVDVTVPGGQSLTVQGASLISAREDSNVVLLVNPLPSKSYYVIPPQRRLLQQQASQALTPDALLDMRPRMAEDAAAPTTRLRLPAMRMPLLGNGAYFSCCDALPSVEDAAACRALQGVHRSAYALVGDAPPQAPCASRAPPSRRLLQTASDTRCAIGTFKPERGDTPCAFCPSGATTSDVAVTSAADCQCLPGYVRDGRGCTPCPDGTYRGLADAACLPCPRRHVTQSRGATACVCEPGTFYSSLAAECLDCPAHHHCADGVRTPCPLHGLSPPRSASVADCACDPRGFYGDLSLPDGACYPLTPGLHPSGQCAAGWTRVERTPQWVQCESGCAAGTFARVDPHTGALLACEACPADTYAVDGTLVDACTGCPMGRGTAGRTGQTALAACRCLLGVSTSVDECAGCGADLYLDPLDRVCLPCPAGWASPPNSVGVGACQCPPGAYAFGSACAPCPLGTYSHAMGLTCTPCPKGCTTNAPGQTTYAACYCGQRLLSSAG